MKATIDIKTPAGKSLEGFPTEMKQSQIRFALNNNLNNSEFYIGSLRVLYNLHPGDTITITIQKE